MSCNVAESSGLLNADTAVLASPGRFMGLQVLADGTNAATVVIYDNASAASGTVLCKVIVDAGLVYQDAHVPEGGLVCNKGIYADVTGTGAEFIVQYIRG